MKMKLTNKDLQDPANDNEVAWWVRQLTKQDLTQIADKLGLNIATREKKPIYLERILAVTDFTIYNEGGRKYQAAFEAMSAAKKSPIGIIIRHAESDWTRRVSADICSDCFGGLSNVGARIIAVKI